MISGREECCLAIDASTGNPVGRGVLSSVLCDIVCRHGAVRVCQVTARRWVLGAQPASSRTRSRVPLAYYPMPSMR